MRNILFKAKDLKGNWVEGDLVHSFEGTHIVSSNDDFKPSNDQHPTLINVIPETVCQYTGLKDKNGKMIFDGDELSYKEELRHIEYMDDQCRYILTNGKGYDTRNCINLDCDIVYYSELTGNIHD